MSEVTCYIAGPMRGYSLYNFPAFYAAQAELILSGWQVINPAEKDALEYGLTIPKMRKFPKDHDWTKLPECMGHIRYSEIILNCLILIEEKCDAICMLPGWQKSTGAVHEYEFAVKMKGIPAFDADHIVNLNRR